MILRRIALLVAKDITLELRLRESLVLLFVVSLATALVFSIGVELSFIPRSVIYKLFPSFVWTVFVLAASSAVARSCEYDFESRAIDSVLQSGAKAHEIYLAKWITTSTILALTQLILSSILATLLNVPFVPSLDLAVLTVIMSGGYSALTCLLGAITYHARMRSVLLSMLLLPLVMPLFICGAECSQMILIAGTSIWSSDPFLYLTLTTIVYVAAGSALFEFAIRD